MYLSDLVLDQYPSEFIWSFVGEEEEKLQQMYKATWLRWTLATSEHLSQASPCPLFSIFVFSI